MTNDILKLYPNFITVPTDSGVAFIIDDTTVVLTLEETMKLKRYLEDVLYAT